MIEFFTFFTILIMSMMPLYQIIYNPNMSSTLFFFWALFCSYHIFVLIILILIDHTYMSHFYGSIFIEDKTLILSLVYIMLFIFFFNIKIPKLTPINVNKQIPISIFWCLLILSPFYFIKFIELQDTLNLYGYNSLYITDQNNRIVNFFTKYLPFILTLVFFATNQSKKLHFLFFIPLIAFNLPVFLTGQRTVFIIFLILWTIVFVDVFVKSYKTKIFIFFGIPTICFVIGFLGLFIRGGEVKNLEHFLLVLGGFSKPMSELFYVIQPRSKVL